MSKRCKKAKVTCMCGCGRRFVKTTYNRIYASVLCKDRVAQRNLRERAKLYPERAALEFGSIGRQP